MIAAECDDNPLTPTEFCTAHPPTPEVSIPEESALEKPTPEEKPTFEEPAPEELMLEDSAPEADMMSTQHYTDSGCRNPRSACASGRRYLCACICKVMIQRGVIQRAPPNDSERSDSERVSNDSESAPNENTHDITGHHIARLVIEWITVAVVSLALALVLRTFVVQAFFIPSISMHPTLHVGDRIVVDKIGYRFREIGRGDVVVFSKLDTSSDISELIKRVVAVGGDTFEIKEGTVHINGMPQDEPYLQPSTVTLPKSAMSGCANAAMSDRCEVPEGMILVLGDNREASQDGRFFGPVDVDTVVGRAFLRIWPPGSIGGL